MGAPGVIRHGVLWQARTSPWVVMAEQGRTTKVTVRFRRIVADTRAASVSVGTRHACAVLRSGRVACWGANDNGQTGDHTTINALVPVPVPGVTHARKVDVATDHACALLTGGRVKCWGHNNHGQTGQPAAGGHEVAQLVPRTQGAVDVATGHFGSCAALSSGRVVCWGDVPRNSSLSSITTARSVDMMEGHMCVTLRDSTSRCWGENGAGQLGVDPGDSFEPLVTPVLAPAVGRLSVGGGHTCAVNPAGAAWCWGSNVRAQLGSAKHRHQAHFRPVPITGLDSPVSSLSAGMEDTCAITRRATLWCWGGNIFGQAGTGSPSQIQAAPGRVTAVPAGSRVVSVSMGDLTGCAVSEPGVVSCWGDNRVGQLGLGYWSKDRTHRTPTRVRDIG
ncbi:MAG: hypothetical protein U0R64_10685 [Candidatus Nanopelagicales bacterium]